MDWVWSVDLDTTLRDAEAELERQLSIGMNQTN